LDEPTNHLDIPAAEILEEALAGFEGTVLLVSHDRRFLENVTTRIVRVTHEGVDIYPGSFKELGSHLAKKAAPRSDEQDDDDESTPYERGGAPRKTKPEPTKRAEPAPKAQAPAAKPADTKLSFEQQKLQAREKERKKRRIKELEDLIAAGEKQLEERRKELREDPGGDWAKLAEKAKEEQALAKRVETMMDEWTRLSETES
jgi:ATP-binding cassette subfamily F protein 3